MDIDPVKLNAAITIGFNLIKAGMEIVALKDKGDLTEEDLIAIIERENAEQANARAALLYLLPPAETPATESPASEPVA